MNFSRTVLTIMKMSRPVTLHYKYFILPSQDLARKERPLNKSKKETRFLS